MFTRSLFLTLLAVLMFASLSPIAWAEDAKTDAPATQPSGLTGTWKWEFEGWGGQSMEFTFHLKQDGDQLSGNVIGFNGEDSPIMEGRAGRAGQFSFKTTRDFGGQTAVTTYSGQIEDGKLVGTSETVFSRKFEAKSAGN